MNVDDLVKCGQNGQRWYFPFWAIISQIKLQLHETHFFGWGFEKKNILWALDKVLHPKQPWGGAWGGHVLDTFFLECFFFFAIISSPWEKRRIKFLWKYMKEISVCPRIWGEPSLIKAGFWSRKYKGDTRPRFSHVSHPESAGRYPSGETANLITPCTFHSQLPIILQVNILQIKPAGFPRLEV